MNLKLLPFITTTVLLSSSAVAQTTKQIEELTYVTHEFNSIVCIISKEYPDTSLDNKMRLLTESAYGIMGSDAVDLYFNSPYQDLKRKIQVDYLTKTCLDDFNNANWDN